jgi:hypothetical protein
MMGHFSFGSRTRFICRSTLPLFINRDTALWEKVTISSRIACDCRQAKAKRGATE